MHLTRRTLLAAVPIVLLASRASAQQTFKLTVARKFKGPNCTSGYLAVNGQVICHVLELPWKGNAPEISSIPDGTYNASLRYDHADKWRIELSNVPGRTNVQLHTGNTPADSKGCILVGKNISSDLCSVSDSKTAYDELRTAFYGTQNPVSTPNLAILVEVVS